MTRKKEVSLVDFPKLGAQFGRVVKARRKKLSLIQAKVARYSKLSLLEVGRIERGECVPSLDSVFRLAYALSVTPGHLVSRTHKLTLKQRNKRFWNVPTRSCYMNPKSDEPTPKSKSR